MSELIDKATIETLFERISSLITFAHQKIASTVNLTMVYTYYEIGRTIIENEQDGNIRAAYGKQVLKKLSDRLNANFGKGYSVDNLENMRQFFLTFSKSETVSRISSDEISETKSFDLFHPKGKGKGTYYLAGKRLMVAIENLSAPPQDLSASVQDLSTPPQDLSAPPQDLSTPVQDLSTPPLEMEKVLQTIVQKIEVLNKREHDSDKVKEIIIELCGLKPMKASEIASYFKKGEGYIKRKYLSEMIKEKQLSYLYQEMLNHPEQAYLTTEKIEI